MDSQLEYENFQVLSLVQAMLGAVSNNLRAASLRCDGKTVHFYFLLAEESLEDREQIEDIIFEWEALQLTNVSSEVHIAINNAPLESITLLGRIVFLRSER